MDKEPHPGDYADPRVYVSEWDKWKARQTILERSPRGHRMPDTREQFELMGKLYDEAFERTIVENRKLRIEINNLKQKLEVYRRQLSENKTISKMDLHDNPK